MELKTLRKYLLSKKGAVEDRPFGPDTLVFKVMGKMFALTQDLEKPESISLKCDPDDALALRAKYPAIKGAYHLNKRHWNGIQFDGSVPESEILALIDDSYDLVAAGLTKSAREILAEYLD